MRTLLVLACLAVPAVGVACDQSDLEKLLEAIPPTPIERRAALTGRGLKIACSTWPAPLLKGLDGLAMVPPDMRALIEAKAVAEAPVAWMAACPGGLRALTRLAQVAAAEKRPQLYRACKVARFGFATEAEFKTGKGAELLPIPVAQLLSKTRLKRTQRRTILRALAGIGTAAEVKRSRLDRLIVPRMRRLELPKIEPPPEPEPPPPPPVYEGLEVQRVRLSAGCPSDRAQGVLKAVEAAGRGCRGARSEKTVAVRLALTVAADGAVGDVRVVEGTLGSADGLACLRGGLAKARLGAAGVACTVGVEAVRPE